MQLHLVLALALACLAAASPSYTWPSWSADTVTITLPASTVSSVVTQTSVSTTTLQPVTVTTTTTATTTVTLTPSPAATCVTDSYAEYVIASFINLITETGANFNQTLADELLAPNYQDYSDSIDYIMQIPLGSISFSNRSDFITVAGTQPAFPAVTTMEYYHTCSEIFWRYRLDVGTDMPLPVMGINIFTVDANKQVSKLYAEQNSGAFLYNLGRPECLSNFTASAGKATVDKRGVRRLRLKG